MEVDFSTFGIDWDGPVPDEEDTVVIPEVSLDLTDDQRQTLLNIAHRQNAETELEWITTYVECKQLVYEFLRAN